MTDETPNKALGLSISRNALLLALFALVSTAIIAGTNLGTADRIAEQKKQAKLKALYEILPQHTHDNNLLEDNRVFFEESLGHRQEQILYIAMVQKKITALIYPVTARDGYSGDIDMLVGINAKDGSIAGVRVLSHRETPGLGDKIEARKSNWIMGFNGMGVGNPPLEGWAVRKDGGIFDAFTGATITPRAVTAAILRVLQYHGENFPQLQRDHDIGIGNGRNDH